MDQKKTEPAVTVRPESLYRTRWLIAHNRLHDAAHKGILVDQVLFDEYLAELRTAEDIASKPA